MHTPGRTLQSGEETINYQYYKKWQQKRLEAKEKIKEKLNMSLSPLKALEEPLTKPTLIKRDLSNNALAANPKKAPSVKERIQEMSTKSQVVLSTARPSLKAKPEEGTMPKKFDDLLNDYFSVLPTTLVSPSKEAVTKPQKIIKDIVTSIRSTTHDHTPSHKTDKAASFYHTQAGHFEQPKQSSLHARKGTEPSQLDEGATYQKQRAKAITRMEPEKSSILGLLPTSAVYPQTTRSIRYSRVLKEYRIETTNVKLMKDEVKKLQAHLDQMSPEEYFALPLR